MKATMIIVGALIMIHGFANAKERQKTNVLFIKQQLYSKYISEGASIGDINADGKPDVVSGALWWEGPSFTKSHAFSTVKSYPIKGAKPVLANYAENFFSFPDELSKDKWLDLVLVGIPGKPAHLLVNPGENKCTPDSLQTCPQHHIIHPSVGHESPQYLDIIGDTQKELLFFSDGRITLAQAPKNFHQAWRLFYVSDSVKPKKPFMHGLGAGDVNGDGLQDILEKDGWWEQPEDWDMKTFWVFHPFPFARKGGAQMFAYDFNGDGHNDVLTALDAHGYGLVWYEHVKDGEKITFKQHIIMADKPDEAAKQVSFSQPHALLCSDIDGDGINDVVTGKTYYAHLGKDSGAEAPAVLYWFKTQRNANNNVTFTPYLIDDNSGIGRQISAQDVNNDGKPDIVTSNKKGVFIFMQK